MVSKFLEYTAVFTMAIVLMFSLSIYAQEDMSTNDDNSDIIEVVVDKNADKATKITEPEQSPEENKINKKIDIQTNDEEVFREKIEAEANQIAIDARKAFEKNQYKSSITYYLEAINLLNKSSKTSRPTIDRIKNIQQNMAVVYLYWGRETAELADKDANAGQYDEAIKKCITAMKIEPALTQKMERLIKKYQKMKSNTLYKNATSEDMIDPNKQARLFEIDVLLLQGKKLIRQELWHRAREKFEKVLLIDPYNMKAIKAVKKVTGKMFRAGVNRFETLKDERAAEIEWNYVSPLIERSLAETDYAPAPIEKEQFATKIKEKLQSIIIDHMEFEDATITAVVNLLRIRAKDLDPTKEGINIFLRLGDSASATSVEDTGDDDLADADDFLDDDEEDADYEDADADDDDNELIEDAAGGEGSNERTITIMFDDLSLGEAIRNICIAADMNHRVEEYAVVIASKSVALDNLETRIYPVEQDAFADMGAGDAAEGATTSVADYFKRRGIDFPTGARVVYDNSISRLIATNTQENLQRIEQIIHELNVIDPQVLIEAKFVEIQENKTDEMGFQWTMNRTSPSGNGVSFDDNDQTMRYDGNLANRLQGNDVAFDVSRTVNGLSMNMKIHAMDISDRTDVLSCPRITTQNGEEATIKMVTEQYFPEAWGETTVISDILGTGFMSAMPEFGEATDLGVTMTVTPTVDPDKYTISLDVIPVVQAHVGWVDYSYTVPDGAGGQLSNVIIMPIIEARTIQTQITIYDGETVVMGGIMRDITATVDDRIPILGDLPLIGRAFRTKYVDKSKANLLIFTTVRLVNPDGSPLREREVRGKPPFRM